MEPGAKLFVQDPDTGGQFGDGKYRLLQAVREYGSLRKAAENLGRGYRKAWEDLKRTEKALGRMLVERSRGGANGGSSELTEFGNELLDAWKNYSNSVHRCIDSSYEKYLRELIEGENDE